MLTQRLRHRVDIDYQVQTQDATTGAVAVTWAAFLVDEPAEIVPLSGREFIQSAAMQSQVTVRATIRYQSGIDASMRIRFDGETYKIQAILPDPSARRWLTLMLAKGVSDGD
jgi:SPP1 family predicted phage head-tail adaptor